MSNILSLDNISHAFSDKELFTNLKLVVNKGDKIGIIGANGTGKSTILKIIAGKIEVDSGEIIKSKDLKVAYLHQHETFNSENTIIEEFTNQLKNKLSEVELNIQADKVLYSAGFTDFDVKINTLSGGWKKRLSLSILFASNADLMLLDEPTNHLDFEGLIWIENELKRTQTPWILVSHDRYLLEKTVTSIAEIAPFYEDNILKLDCAYLKFIERKKEILADIETQIAKLKNKFKNEKEWVVKAPRARGTKANYRVKAFAELSEKLKTTQNLIPKEQKKISFSSSGVGSKELAEFINVSLNFDEKEIIKDFNYKIKNGMRIGILGKNGQGKSTILKLLVKELEPTKGKIKLKDNLKIVYFDQLKEKLNPNDTLKYILAEGSDHVIYQDKPVHYISYGKRFGFDLIDFEKKCGDLSGGEKARLLLSILVRQDADLLVLDEPTNDLDIEMLEILETMLLEFSGSLVIVSHDRFLLSNCCNTFIGFDSDNNLFETANYTQWQEKAFGTKQTKAERKQAAKKMTEAERKEYGKMEKKILKAEEDLEKLTLKAAKPEIATSAEQSIEVAKEIKEKKELIKSLYDRWEELEELK